MTSSSVHPLIFASAVVLLAMCASASAQDLGSLKGMAGDSGMTSMVSDNAGNAAGVIQFCIKNNYLSGDVASTMKDKLLGKVGASEESADDNADYANGAKGLLSTGNGNTMDLANAGGLKKSLTKKACESVLENAKSFL